MESPNKKAGNSKTLRITSKTSSRIKQQIGKEIKGSLSHLKNSKLFSPFQAFHTIKLSCFSTGREYRSGASNSFCPSLP